MSRQSSPQRPDAKPSVRPGLVGGPTTESIPGTAHDDPLDPLGRRKKQIVVSLPPENDGGEAALSDRPRETDGEPPLESLVSEGDRPCSRN